MCVADWVMYRQVLAEAATDRGWSVHWYEAKSVLAAAANALRHQAIDDVLDAAKRAAGSPWQKDHKLAFARKPFANLGRIDVVPPRYCDR